MTAEWLCEAECRQILGERLGNRFIVEFSGMTIYVPQEPKEPHEISAAIGMQGMSALCKIYGGSDICVAGTRAHIRKNKIISLYEQGLSNSEIAKMVSVTERYVRSVLAPFRNVAKCSD